MEYLFRLPDGRRLALWSERNQIIRLVSGGGSRSQSVIRSDFLSDLSAAMYDGKIYFVYQNTSGSIMLHVPEDEEDTLLFGERLESCRHGGLTLAVWRGRLYLLYTAWNPVREAYALKMRELPMNDDGDEAENRSGAAARDMGACPEQELLRDLEEAPVFRVLVDKHALNVLSGEECLRLTPAEDGSEHWERGRWLGEERIVLQKQVSELEAECSVLQEQIRDLEDEVGGLQEKMKRLTIESGALKESDRVKGETAAALQKENDILYKRVGELQAANQLLTGQQQATQAHLTSAVSQYNELAELTRQLQQEGKKWRDRYYQETKKKKERSGAVKVKRVSE